MRFRKILAALLLAVTAGSSMALAQAIVSPVATKVPWNGYVMSRIPNDYTPIIGVPGTTLIASSQSATNTSLFNLPLPFSFRFMGTDYAAGFVLKVATSGFISFSGQGSTSGVPNLLLGDGNTRLLAPYWSELQANTVVEGGTYWRVDGPIGARVLTVEWRVMGITTKQPTRNPGQFQAKLFEGSNKIEFFYGPNSINRAETGTTATGAFIGLKNQGQQNVTPGSEDDSQKFLMIMNPDVVRDTLALTRTRTAINMSGGLTAENSAIWPTTIAGLGTSLSRFFSYRFPSLGGAPIGFRISAVTDDAASDQVLFEPSRPGNVFTQGSSFLIRGVFRNLGSNVRQNVPVELQVLRGNTILETRTGTAFPSPTGTGVTSTVTFAPPISSTVTAIPGTYVARIIIKLTSPTDLDRTNDTLRTEFIIAYPRDVKPLQIQQPIPYTPAAPAVYTIGSPVTVEGRFLNTGQLTLANVPVGFIIRDASCAEVYRGNSVVRGQWAPLEQRDVVFETQWSPLIPGQYYVQIFTDFSEDEQRSNDTLPGYPSCGRPFDVRYEREVRTDNGLFPGVEPASNGNYPLGRPLNVRIAYRNNGVTDATNVPSYVEIRDPSGALVYTRSLANGVLSVPGEASGSGTTVYEYFPFFVPRSGPGSYCVTAVITDPADPVRNNDTSRWCFNVQPPLVGTIYVGTGERFRTIQEANDSLFYYGVGGPVNFKLVDDIFTVRPDNDDALRPALDARGDVIGSGPNSVVTWTAAEGKTSIRIVLKSPSGTGIVYGQRDTLNPTGYITWDGGPTKNLTFILDTAGNQPPTRAIPFLFSQGSSNFTVRNVNILPATINLGRKNASVLPVHEYFTPILTFKYTKDDSLAFSSGILLRNSAPSNSQNQNPGPRSRDTLFNQNNLFEGNVIKNFAYGISSIGAGPLYSIGRLNYIEFNNRNNRIMGNTIDSVTRAGVAIMFEQNSEIAANTITNVQNPSATVAHAAGIWVAAGGQTGVNDVKNRGYSTDLLIQRNKIAHVSATVGNAVGIWAETNENVFFQDRVFRFPVNAATNFRIWNNMMWDYRTLDAANRSAGIGLSMAGNTRIDLVTTGNNIDNNTLFNQIAGTAQEYGVLAQRANSTVRNNIISILSQTTNPIGLVIQGPNASTNTVSDYNLFWVPNGFVGTLSNLSVSGFNIPSPPTAKTLNQWRALTGQDKNSLEGNIANEFVSITPGAEDLHIRTTTVGSLANNRGTVIAGMAVDIDNDPRNSGGGTSRPDIGADEFNGVVRNNDVTAEDVLTPSGYRAQTGQFSDAEYVMVDSVVALNARFRNMGGLPQLSNTVRLSIEYYNPTSSSWIPVSSQPSYTQTMSFDVAQGRDVNFGTFAPRSLRQVGINDAYFGLNQNVSPLYRVRVTSGTDDFAGNNVYEKTLRFYVRRSNRSAIVSVENRTTVMPVDAIGKSNKLNADTLLAALDSIRWHRTDGVGTDEDFDLFDRDRWPKENLNFTPWKMVIWAQGAEAQGLEPEERAALKVMLDSRDMYNRSNLILAGQDVSRIHDVALSASNGNLSDQDFVNNYLRAAYRGNTNPAVYSNRVIRGVAINPGKYERIMPTGVVGDAAPTPALVRPTTGDGIARATHHYWEQEFGAYVDSAAGVATASQIRNVVFYAIDWRHYGRFAFEANRSGAQRLLLAGLDFTNQYAGVVPVNVSAFEANQSGRKAVRVEWTTASEVDVASLEVERAVIERTAQGVREGVYSLIDRKAPAGTATRGAKYSILDQNVEMGVEYRYRLVSVGLDGSRSVDAMDEVKIIGAGESAGFVLSVQPNPARTSTTVELRMPEAGKASVKLYDAAGRLVRVLVDRAELGAVSTLELSVEDLASGVYTIAVETSTTSLVQKLNVQK